VTTPPPPRPAFPPPPENLAPPGNPVPTQYRTTPGYKVPPSHYAQGQLPPGHTPPGYPYGRPVSPSGHRLADFGDRLVAKIIDQLILSAIAGLVVGPIYVAALLFLISEFEDQASTGGLEFVIAFLGLLFAIFALFTAVAYVYEVEMMFRGGQTIGKRVMKIKVIPMDPHQPLTRLIAFRRFLVEHGAAAVPGFAWVDGLWQLWDKPYQQCLHDKFARTAVIKLNP
jgi:uncharacterized RDD family membrane protein YckC